MSSGHPRPGEAHAAHMPGLHHQFDSYEQQRESAALGMWFFLVQELMFFGGVFATYVVYRVHYPWAYAAGSQHLDIRLGAFNTVVLIASSLTMAMGVRSAQLGRRKPLVLFLILTILLGATFLGVKAVEYHHKYVEKHIPTIAWEWHESEFAGHEITPNQVRLYFGLYFGMTGLHAMHMVIGIGILLWMLWPAWRGHWTPENHNFVEGVGLYWHFVDIVWIFLFPLLYLIGRS